MSENKVTQEEMLKRVVRHKDFKKTEGVPFMYIDSSLDRHYRVHFSWYLVSV